MAQKNNFIAISKSWLLVRHCFVANGVMDDDGGEGEPVLSAGK